MVILVLAAIGSLGRSDEPATLGDAAPTSPAATPVPSQGTTASGSNIATPAFVVLSPADGAVVQEAVVQVRGMAPAGARIVRDISLAPDQDAMADANGNWLMDVALSEGQNDLAFRLGDDRSTALMIIVTFTPPGPTPEPVAEQTETPSEVPTEAPTLEPTPEPTTAYATFDDGTWIVGDEIKAGTYRLREPTFMCYWARLKGFGGSLGEIIANDNVTGYAVVTIGKKDAGFESAGCGTWSKDLSRVTASRTRFGEGTFIVNTDIKPGTYRSSGGDACYWARLRNFGGTLGGIIANGLTQSRAVVTIRSSDAGFVSKGCGDWVRK